MNTYWKMVGMVAVASGVLLVALAPSIALAFSLGAVLAGIAGMGLRTHVLTLRYARPLTAALVILSGAVLVGVGAFLHQAYLVGAGVTLLLGIVYASVAYDLQAIDGPTTA